MLDAIAEARAKRTSRDVMIRDLDIIIKNQAPGVSSLYNKFGLGFKKKTPTKKK